MHDRRRIYITFSSPVFNLVAVSGNGFDDIPIIYVKLKVFDFSRALVTVSSLVSLSIVSSSVMFWIELSNAVNVRASNSSISLQIINLVVVLPIPEDTDLFGATESTWSRSR